MKAAKKFLSVMVQVFAVFLLFGCTSRASDLVGTWKGTDDGGVPTTMFFQSDGSVRVVTGNSIHGDGQGGGRVEWRLDESKTPMLLTLKFTEPGGATYEKDPMTVEFLDPNMIQIGFGGDQKLVLARQER